MGDNQPNEHFARKKWPCLPPSYCYRYCKTLNKVCLDPLVKYTETMTLWSTFFIVICPSPTDSQPTSTGCTIHPAIVTTTTTSTPPIPLHPSNHCSNNAREQDTSTLAPSVTPLPRQLRLRVRQGKMNPAFAAQMAGGFLTFRNVTLCARRKFAAKSRIKQHVVQVSSLVCRLRARGGQGG